ncbi:MAG: hypothetical protein H0W28_00190 [Pyrinomonadaceae bacterium]|nr:hypothetical protein [Pyrinomonadaceae bacterium]
MHRFKSSLIASIGPMNLMMILTAFTLVIAVFGGQARGDSIFVDAGANPGGDGSAAAPYQTITEAIAQAREIRQRKPHSKINVHVAPGVYSEAFPIYLNISKLSLRGSTKLIEDHAGLPQDCGPGAPALPAPCIEAGTETLITPLTPLQSGQDLFIVGPTSDRSDLSLTDVSVEGFVFDGRATNLATSGMAIFVDRVDDFLIDHNVSRGTLIATFTRLSSGKIRGQFVYGSNDAFFVTAGSDIYPATVVLQHNRVTRNNQGTVAVGVAAVKLRATDPNRSPLQTMYDPALHPEEVPNKLTIKVTENDFSRNNTFGFRFQSYVSGNLFYDTTNNQPMTANVTAMVKRNSFTNNGEYGLTVEGAFATRSNPRVFTATFTGKLRENDLIGNGRAGIFAGFMLNGVVTRNPGLINTNKHLRDSTFNIRADESSLASGLDYDNPLLDPFDHVTPLNNQLQVNGDLFTGRRLTCPPGFPCAP